jgi:hypothetical protein
MEHLKRFDAHFDANEQVAMLNEESSEEFHTQAYKKVVRMRNA